MNTEHLSEEDLQSFSTGELPVKADTLQHLENCPNCQQQLAAYQQIIHTIKVAPPAAFDFDLENAVLQQLQVVKPTVKKHNYYQHIPHLLVAVVVTATLYIFRQNFLNLSAGISSLFLAISAISCITIIAFKVAGLYRQYNQQIKKLNFSE